MYVLYIFLCIFIIYVRIIIPPITNYKYLYVIYVFLFDILQINFSHRTVNLTLTYYILRRSLIKTINKWLILFYYKNKKTPFKEGVFSLFRLIYCYNLIFQ